MPKKHVIYVRLEDKQVGILGYVDSSNKQGKYAVTPKGCQIMQYFPTIHSRITETEYNETSAIKQPAKKGKKS